MVPLIEKLPFESVSNNPIKLASVAAKPGTNCADSSSTRYAFNRIPEIPVVFSVYCSVPVTLISDEPSLSYSVGVHVKLTISISSGSGQALNGIQPRSSPPAD